MATIRPRGRDDRRREHLRVDRLLPLEVLELFDENTRRPGRPRAAHRAAVPRARPDRNNTFDAFFGRTEDGVLFRSSFDLNFDIRELIGDPDGTPTRCGYMNDGIASSPLAGQLGRDLHGVRAREGGGREQRQRDSAERRPVAPDMLVNTSCQIRPQAPAGVGRCTPTA
jgi:hypothetical protein